MWGVIYDLSFPEEMTVEAKGIRLLANLPEAARAGCRRTTAPSDLARASTSWFSGEQ
jgi:hypothetical protein